MSAVVYSEPYKLPAGILALVMQGAFFALMYFGVSWEAQPTQGMVVDIWESLPEPENIPAKDENPPLESVEPVKPPEAPKLSKPVELPKPKAVVPPKADIQLVEKKKPLPKPVEHAPASVPSPAPQPSAAELQKVAQAEAEQNAQREQARIRAEEASQAGRVINEFVGKIQAKIKSNIVRPPDVPKGARAEFSVTLLPGGTILNVRLTKRSGDDSYDKAVERAIYKSQPLPLPPDVALFSKFRDLKLGFNAYDIEE